ncbi:hypothetical protein HPB50_004238 [Hyalomma asiaticum]|uniref:Uncharacterized protein n=1 Tax=Hyalomma asiaticum TaxID=266040 RepID=A0ACB7RUM6_HYAAI|nr:hypothetical protein HPB50_004238 [Hyalomma asiaticum]
MDDSDKGSEGSVSGNEMGRAHELKLEIEALKLQLELEKLKSARVLQDATQAQSQTSGLGRYAKDIKAVLAPMPADDTMIPAWFKNADSLLKTLAIPEEMQGALILPFLSDKIRTSVRAKVEDGDDGSSVIPGLTSDSQQDADTVLGSVPVTGPIGRLESQERRTEQLGDRLAALPNQIISAVPSPSRTCSQLP